MSVMSVVRPALKQYFPSGILREREREREKKKLVELNDERNKIHFIVEKLFQDFSVMIN